MTHGADSDTISARRRSEDRSFASALAARHYEAGILDARVRVGDPVLRGRADATDIAMFEEHLKRLLDELHPKLLLGPLGVGGHVDHLATSAAMCRIVAQQRDTTRMRLLLYEDLPYAAREPHSVESRVRELEGPACLLEPLFIDIHECLPRQLELASLYVSQRPEQWLDEISDYVGTVTPGGRGTMRLWEVSIHIQSARATTA